MEINLYKEKHQIPKEAVKNIPFDNEEYYSSYYNAHEEGINGYCFVQKPKVHVPVYVVPFILNQIKDEFLSKEIEVIPCGNYSFYSSHEGGFELSLDVNSWLGRLEKIGTREKGWLLKKKLDVYRSVPNECSLNGCVEFEKFEGVDPKSIMGVLHGFGFNCKVKSTNKQLEEKLKKMIPPSASDIASAICDEQERRDYLPPEVF